MASHVYFHLHTTMYYIISVLTKILQTLIIKDGAEPMLIQRQYLNGEIVHVEKL